MGTVVLSEVDELETIKISELTEALSAGSSDVLPIVKDAMTRKISKDNFVTVNIANTVHIAKNGKDSNTGGMGDPFLTIQAAIDYVIANYEPNDANNQILIKVFPGEYTEQIHSVDGIHIVGVHSPNNRYSKGARLINVGTEESNYPLRAGINDKYRIYGMNIETVDGTGVLGKLPKGIFESCFFYGQWIENDLDMNISTVFEDCDLRDANGLFFNLTGIDIPGRSNISLVHTLLYSCTPIFSSTHISGANLNITNDTTLTRSALRLSGDWDMRALNSNIANGRQGIEGRSYIGGTGDITIINCVANSGLHFTENPNSLRITGVEFDDGYPTIPAGEADITADVDITNVEYSRNRQHNGLSGKIKIVGSIRNVGEGSPDRYYSVQDAMSSIPADSTGVITIFGNQVDLSKLTLPYENVSIAINGQKQYSLTFMGDVIEVGANQKVGFVDLKNLTGEKIELNGANAEVAFESCQYVNGYLTLTLGAFAIVYKSSIFGSTGHKAINIDNVDTIMVVGYSRVQGSFGNAAVEFNAVADEKFKAKFSTFIHGTKTNLSPIVTTAGKVIVSIYSCAGNANLTPAATISNDISSAGNVDDPQIDF